MNRNILVLIAVFLLPFSAFCQNPSVDFEEDSVFFTKVPLAKIQHGFTFRVKEGGRAKIKNVKPDCACSIATFPKRMLEGGYAYSIIVEFDPYQFGPFEKKFEVAWEGITKTDVLVMKGSILPTGVAASTGFSKSWGNLQLKNSVVFFGDISNKSIVKKRVEIYNPTNFPFTFEDSVVKPNYTEVVFIERTIEPRKKLAIDIFYHPELKNDFGYSIDNIRFFTSDLFNPTLDLSISANIFPVQVFEDSRDSPRLWVSSNTLSLGKVFSNGNYVVSFIIYNKGKQPLEISQILPDDNTEIVGISKKTIGENEYSSVKVRVFDIAKTAGAKSRTIKLYSNDPSQGETLLTITADVVK
ncbi:MAG: hypothetical protein ACJAWV_001544 [Flammeovirgaceae bacterium]|jgi:hypothetical protein